MKTEIKHQQLSYRFNFLRSYHGNWGDYLLLSKAVRGMKYNTSVINKSFNRYVPKSDYAQEERDGLLTNLYNVSSNGSTEPYEKVRMLMADSKVKSGT